MKKIAIISLLTMSLSFASLLNTTDQVLNSNPVLGGNPAVYLYNGTPSVEGGATVMDNLAQNGVVLASEKGYSASDRVVPEQFLNDMFIQYNNKISGHWLAFKYGNKDTILESASAKNDANHSDKVNVFMKQDINEISAVYGMDGSRIAKGLTLGAKLAVNKTSIKDVRTPNKSAKDDLGLRNQDLTNSSAAYTSLAFGGIMDLDTKSKLTLAQTFSGARNMDEVGKDIQDNKLNIQYNEEIQPETAVGYIYQYNKDLQLAGTLEMVWNKTYEEHRSQTGTYTEDDVTKRGYNIYTLAAEYAGTYPVLASVLNGITTQCFYGWANTARQITSRDSALDTDGAFNVTNMGINATKAFNADQKVIAGLARTNILGVTNHQMTDETKLYVDYSQML